MEDHIFDFDDTSCNLGDWEEILEEYDDSVRVEDFYAKKDCEKVKEYLKEKHKMYRSSLAFYLKADTKEELRRRSRKLRTTLQSTGLVATREGMEIAPLSSYLRWLPMNFNPADDRKNLYTKFNFVQHLANLMPVFGRGIGTRHPGSTYFNRGGAPFDFDPLNRDDRAKNGHCLILGPTGAGKSATLNGKIAQTVAIYRPRMFIIEAGNSFGLMAEYAERYGLPNTGNGGFPSCKEWWSDGKIGLKARLVEQVEPDTMTKLRKIWNSKEDYTDIVVRRLVSPQNIQTSTGRVYGGYGSANSGAVLGGNVSVRDAAAEGITFIASGLGAKAGSIITAPVFDVIKQALPMVQGIILMVMTILIPLVAIVGSYNIQVIITLSLVQFATFFLSFWWELARWLDNWMINTMYSSEAHSSFNAYGIMNEADDGILGIVVNTMYIVLPALWMAALGWAGFRGGESISRVMDNSMNNTKSVSDQGQKTITSVATKGAKR